MEFTDTVPVDDDFIAPAEMLMKNYVRGAREQTGNLTDLRFLRLGITRVVEGDESGRAFLQALADRNDADISVARSTWFDALHSKRRLGIIEQVAAESYRRFEAELANRDHLAKFPELRDYPIVAVDGHNIEHACHSPKDAKDRHIPSGMIYGLCLHTGLVRPMERFQGDGAKRHEWPIFKANWKKWLTGETRPNMPIIVGDPAYIDMQYWSIEKIRKQAIIITREKENMDGTVYGQIPFDTNDPVNAGIEADEFVGYSNAAMRRIRYRDPQTNTVFAFVTTTRALRPGVVAVLYFLRWKIEKTYDVFKNKLKEQKAWAVGTTSALIQGHFIALVHNLLTLLLARMENHDIREEKVERRVVQRNAKNPPPPSHQMVQHFTILTCQFIRLLRHCFRHETPWQTALPLFRRRLFAYL